MRLLCKVLKFKTKLNIAPKKEKSHAAPPPTSVHWLLQWFGGKNIILLIQSGIVTHSENDVAWIIENNRADCEGKQGYGNCCIWGESHSKENNVLRLDGGSGTIWLKVNKCNAFLYVGKRGKKDPDSYQWVSLSTKVHKTFEHHLEEKHGSKQRFG